MSVQSHNIYSGSDENLSFDVGAHFVPMIDHTIYERGMSFSHSVCLNDGAQMKETWANPQLVHPVSQHWANDML